MTGLAGNRMPLSVTDAIQNVIPARIISKKGSILL